MPQNSSLRNHSNEALEVAVYTVQDAEGFGALQRTAHENLAGIDGWMRGLPLRSLDDPRLRADVVLWKTAEQARQAAEGLPQDSRFAAFLRAIGEVRHFTHYASTQVEALAEIGAAPVVEIAAFKVAKEKPMQALQHKLHRVLPKISGVVASLPGQDMKAEDGSLDLIAWTDRASFEGAPKAVVKASPDLAAFFEAVEETLVFELFEVER